VETEKAGGTNKSVRVLVVDDYGPWHGFVSTMLRNGPEREIIGHVSDGLEAVEQAQQLQPDLILLDIGLPTLNGIEAARRIRHLSPKSKILFVSENRSADIAWEALSTGAGGYVVKSNAARELLPAMNAVLRGGRFVSAGLAGGNTTDPNDEQAHDHLRLETLPDREADGEVTHHEVNFYLDDEAFVIGFGRFIESTLRNGNAVIVLATELHRSAILQRLRRKGVDVDAAVEEKRYVALDVAHSLPTFRFAEHLTTETVKSATERNLRVGVG